MNELVIDRPCRRGSRGQRTRIVQEWLCLHGFGVVIDSAFGPATEHAVKLFQRHEALTDDGIVGEITYARLLAPMTAALCPIEPNGRSLGALMVALGKAHLDAHPREVGGQNRGPWVRLYMRGREGAEWPWCAGFACFILKQACTALATPIPLQTSYSCDSLAASAKERGLFQPEKQTASSRDITPGAFFLSRRTSTDWVHTGIVVSTGNDHFVTIEGNTNDDGSREGYEVCRRIRGYKGKDFILL